LQNDANAKSAAVGMLFKIKNVADKKYAKAKTRHALEGADEGPNTDSEKQMGLMNTLEGAAKEKNIADLNYATATKKLESTQMKALQMKADVAVDKLKKDETSPEVVKTAQTAEESEKPIGLMNTLEGAAKEKNIADLNYANATKKLESTQMKAGAAVAKLKKDETSPSLEAVTTAEETAVSLQGKANAKQLKALKVVTNADEKVEERMKHEEESVQQIMKIKAKAKQDVLRVHNVKERTQKLKLSASEKHSKADAFRGARKQAEDEIDSEETDFDLATMANKIRAAKVSHEAANKKTSVFGHTLKVLQIIDKAAQKEATMVKKYEARDAKQKPSASDVAHQGEMTRKGEVAALNKVTNSAIKATPNDE